MYISICKTDTDLGAQGGLRRSVNFSVDCEYQLGTELDDARNSEAVVKRARRVRERLVVRSSNDRGESQSRGEANIDVEVEVVQAKSKPVVLKITRDGNVRGKGSLISGYGEVRRVRIQNGIRSQRDGRVERKAWVESGG